VEYWERVALKEVENELLKEDPIVNAFEVRRFCSFSKGKGRKRKFSKLVILIRPKGGNGWFSWDGEDDCSLPWDEWATENLDSLQTDEHPGDFLRIQIINLLDKLEGKI